MGKKVVVISLGGSLIIPKEINTKLLLEFRKIIKKNSNSYKFVIVCGGGSIARKYINSLSEIGQNEKLQSLIGISSTRTNARFLNYFFGINPYEGISENIKQIEEQMEKRGIVFCGGLRYSPNETSDSTAVKLAREFKTIFINITNVKGLYDKNPMENKNAKFIPEITFRDFYRMTTKKKYKPGQHMIMDQTASYIILQNRITTYILGEDMHQLDNLLNGKDFIGTTIHE